MSDVEFRITAFDAPVAGLLIEELQSEYVTRYGTGDETPVEPAEFAPPQGIFVIAWDGETPVGCAGVRITEPGLAELKRMYVRVGARRRGVARQLLERMENESRALGATRLRLETGARQPEAVALYTSAGYSEAEPFGHHACHPLAHHLAKAL